MYYQVVLYPNGSVMASKEARKKYQELMCWYGYQKPEYIVYDEGRIKKYREYFPFHVTQRIKEEMDQIRIEQDCTHGKLIAPVDDPFDPNQAIHTTWRQQS